MFVNIFFIENEFSNLRLYNSLRKLNFAMKVREILKIIEEDGWYLARQKGSHRQYKHLIKRGLVTVAGHRLSDDIAIGTLKSILKQAQIDLDI